jgi:hypothetical protein
MQSVNVRAGNAFLHATPDILKMRMERGAGSAIVSMEHINAISSDIRNAKMISG